MCALDVGLDTFAVTFDRFRFSSCGNVSKNVVDIYTIALKAVREAILGLRLAYVTVPMCDSVLIQVRKRDSWYK